MRAGRQCDAGPLGEARHARETLTLLGGIVTCEEHGSICVGGTATHAAIYVAAGPGKCHVSIKRSTAHQLVIEVLMRQLARTPRSCSRSGTTPTAHRRSPSSDSAART